jgi:PD-(D/E)XK nuclease superfamily protein
MDRSEEGPSLDLPSPELTTNQKGAIAETAIVAHATRLGIDVYRPVSEHGRFDMMFVIASRILRVQCKWAVKRCDVISVRLQSCRRIAEGMLYRTYTEDEIDAVAAYCAELDKCYLLPASLAAGRRGIYLRLAPTKNNQSRKIKWATQYEFGAIAQLGERLAGSQKVAGSSPASSISLSPSERVLSACG